MHILYVDESGAVDNPNEQFFVLAGVSVFERGIYHLIEALDQTVTSFGLGNAAEIELHGSPCIKEATRRGVLFNALSVR